GFIAHRLAKKYFNTNDEVVGLDSINDYYDIRLKHGRLQNSGINPDNIKTNQLVTSGKSPNYRFIKMNLEDYDALSALFEREKFDKVCHLAAQPGVRYSIKNPHAYSSRNLIAFLNILEACRHFKIKHLAYASSSSVYGANKTMPFSTHDNVDHPVSLYAATKKSNELMAHAYSNLYDIPTTGLRFFTVYGPWGRPDMAPFLFTKAILEGKPINVFNNGKMSRDFTYVEDIVEGVFRVIGKNAAGNKEWSGETPDPAGSYAPYRLYNIGLGNPVPLLGFIETIEKALGIEAQKNFMPMQPGDVLATWADTKDLEKDIDYKPTTTLAEGIGHFVRWYKEFYK
ncbi:MAG: NAD-dependent epimerase, partial [bacterium]|nr:NAD-dependent epimerase [bacterium]